MNIDINQAVQGLANKIFKRDPKAKLQTIPLDPKKPVRFNVNLPPMAQHLVDLRVEMSDKVEHPYVYWYAIMFSPFDGVKTIRYYPINGDDNENT